MNVEISDGAKVVHVNQLQHRVQPKSEEVSDS